MGELADHDSASIGRAPATLAEVAKQAGVSIATASFVLSGRSGGRSTGSPETQAKVRRAAEALGYLPNRYARAMRTGRSDAIVLAMGTIGDPWTTAVAKAVRSRALDRGLSTVLLADESWFSFLSSYSFDAAFITSTDFEPDGHNKVRQLARAGIDLVAFSERIEPEGFDVIRSSALASTAAAYRLFSQRHEKVSFLANASPAVGKPSRQRAFVEAALSEGDTVSAAGVVHGGWTRREAYEFARRWLADSEPPTAVVCSTGYLAMAMQSAAITVGIRVPEDLEIVSIGDVPAEAQYLAPISYFGVRDVFERIADIVVARASERRGKIGIKHVFDWEFFPGATTLPQAKPENAEAPPAR